MPLGKTAETQVHALNYITVLESDHVIHLGLKIFLELKIHIRDTCHDI